MEIEWMMPHQKRHRRPIESPLFVSDLAPPLRVEREAADRCWFSAAVFEPRDQFLAVTFCCGVRIVLVGTREDRRPDPSLELLPACAHGGAGLLGNRRPHSCHWYQHRVVGEP